MMFKLALQTLAAAAGFLLTVGVFWTWLLMLREALL
jgi:hypothetical protein